MLCLFTLRYVQVPPVGMTERKLLKVRLICSHNNFLDLWKLAIRRVRRVEEGRVGKGEGAGKEGEEGGQGLGVEGASISSFVRRS